MSDDNKDNMPLIKRLLRNMFPAMPDFYGFLNRQCGKHVAQ